MPPKDKVIQYGTLLLHVEEIRAGNSLANAGWAMGPFYPNDDIRHSAEFEIKEWDINSIQPSRKNHADNGTEYIAVLEGVLTAHIGGASDNGTGVELAETIEVRADQRLILAAGVWRRFEGSADVRGITIRKPAR